MQYRIRTTFANFVGRCGMRLRRLGHSLLLLANRIQPVDEEVTLKQKTVATELPPGTWWGQGGDA